MERYKCSICGYVYNPEEGEPERGIPSGISFSELPDSYTCPVCGSSKNEFFVYD
ncbi:MAG: rubredoxin [Bacteroidota bacterium]|nr:rubredoxin [Bacteroidota bacterium]